MGAIPAGAVAAIAGSEEAAAAGVSGAQAMQVMNATHVRQLKLPYVLGESPVIKNVSIAKGNAKEENFSVPEDSEILVSIVRESGEPHDVGLFKKTMVRDRVVLEMPLPQAINEILPDSAMVLDVVFDWHNGLVRVFYAIP